MPSGRVRWFDAKKGFGFIESDDGHDVFLPQTALPKDTRDVRKGAKVEYSVIDGSKGPVAMDVTFVKSAPSLVKATRPKPDDMAAIVEDLIKLSTPRATSCAATGTPRPRTARNSPRCCAPWRTISMYRND